MENRTKKRLGLLLKLGLSFVLMGYAFSQVEVSQLFVLKGIRPFWLGVGFLVFLAAYPIGSLRWRTLLRTIDHPVTYLPLLNLFLRGQFFNTFVPTGYAGDLYKGLALSNSTQSRILNLWTVMVDRGFGLLSLCLCAYLAISMNASGLIATGAGHLHLAAGGAIAALFLIQPIIRHLAQKNRLGRRQETIEKLAKIVTPQTSFKVLLLALLSNIFMILTYFLISQALNTGVDFSVFFMAIPLVTMATFLPIAISGIGLREVSTIHLFALFKIAPIVALQISLVYWLFTLLAALVCGLAFFVDLAEN